MATTGRRRSRRPGASPQGKVTGRQARATQDNQTVRLEEESDGSGELPPKQAPTLAQGMSQTDSLAFESSGQPSLLPPDKPPRPACVCDVQYCYRYTSQKEHTMKHKKLTLRLEGALIEKAKRFARDHDTSVSRMVAGFFENLERPRLTDRRHGRITSRLRGSLKPEEGRPQSDREDYLRYLEEKHG